MSTRKETAEFILEQLDSPKHFSVRQPEADQPLAEAVFKVTKMFGEYALYADGKVVGLICNDQLYVKILPASAELEDICEKDEAYPGSKQFYVVEEVQLSKMKNLSEILLNIAKSLPAKPRPSGYGRGKPKKKKTIK
jgi:TfoX/Sxy family transcriptional regulator of competence genes